MTRRRPPGVPLETWVDRRVREAAAQGAFDGLSTAGKPLDAQALGGSAGEWVVTWARREGADLVMALPPALALRVERERLVVAVPGLSSEAAVTCAVTAFNESLDAAYRRPQEQPPVAVPFLVLERQLDRWRAAHPEPSVVALPAPGGLAPLAVGGRRRWWLLGRRRRQRP